MGIKEPLENEAMRDVATDIEVSQFMKVMQHLYQNNKLNRIVLDEVHIVEKWGETFRDAYSTTKLQQLKQKFPNVPLLGLTATITVENRINLVQKLKYSEDYCLFISPFNRKNLNFKVRETIWGHDK